MTEDEVKKISSGFSTSSANLSHCAHRLREILAEGPMKNLKQRRGGKMKKLMVVIGMIIISSLFPIVGNCISISNEEFGDIVADSIGEITVRSWKPKRSELRDAIVKPLDPLEERRDNLKTTYENLDIEGLAQQGKSVQEIVDTYTTELTQVAKGALVLAMAQKLILRRTRPGAAIKTAQETVDKYAETEEGKEKINTIVNNLAE